MEHKSGFLFKDAQLVSAKEMWSNSGELNFSRPDKAGFISQIKYGN